MTDLLDTVKKALATVDDPAHESDYATHAISQATDHDGNPVTVVITWDQIRALVAEVEHARAAHDTVLAHANELERENAALRQRHAEAVRAAWNESWQAASGFKATESAWCSEAWLASEAKARLT